MKVFFFLISFFLILSLAAPLFAEDIVTLRGGERDGYSRLTLEIEDSSSAEYAIDKSDHGKLVVSFDRKANLDYSDIDFSKLDNVALLDVISTDPLKISFTVPKSSNIRDFKIGKRVIIDIHDPENRDEIEAFKTSAIVDKVENEKPPEKLPKEEAKKEVVENLQPNPPAIVLVPEQLPKKISSAKETSNLLPKHHRNKKLKDAVKEENHVVSVRSIKSLEMAAFESYGDLFLVIGNNNTHIVPDLSSPRPDDFSEFRKMAEDEAIVYYMKMPEYPLKMKAIGGYLSWNIVMGEKVKEFPPAKASWKLHDKLSLRGGELFWPLKNIAKIIDVNDIVTGQTLKVVMVEETEQVSGKFLSYIDFDVLRSPVGLAIRPKVDDLQIKQVEGGIEISRKGGGLALSSLKDAREAEIFTERVLSGEIVPSSNNDNSKGGDISKNKDPDSNNFFRFNEWQMGSARDLSKNDNILLSSMKDKSQARKIEDILTLGKMFLSHARGAEALGYFNYALSKLPDLKASPEFRALRGVAQALDRKSDTALIDFLYKGLDKYDEIKYWKSYVLADLGDWRQAVQILPNHYKPIYNYPPQIANRLALVLAEVNLRDGRIKAAEELLALVENRRNGLFDPQKAALKYLRGEADRQNGDIEKTKKAWEELTQDKDDLYRVKAGLALTILLDSLGEIENDKVIDNLERLRYAWRGDELEAQINYWLGKAYFKQKDFVKGLAIMRDAATIAGDTNLGIRIADHMASTFTGFFLDSDLEEVSAIDAVALYEQFSELTPAGDKGNKLIQTLVEHLVRADLLGRATKLLRYQVDHRLKGEEKMRAAIRLAAIELIDKNPQNAVNALGKASKLLRFISDKDEKSAYIKEIALLKIRAYSQNKQFDKALSLLENLEPSKDVNSLRADIAWQAGYWDKASEALNDIIIEENISMTRPLSKEQAELILNRAVALNLAHDRIALANMREKYSDLMLQTNMSHQFDVITRPRHNSALADRKTLLSIVSEVDLFKNFLDSYRTSLPAANSSKALN